MTIDFIQKRIAEQNAYIESLMAKPIEGIRKAEILQSARAQLAYFQGKLKGFGQIENQRTIIPESHPVGRGVNALIPAPFYCESGRCKMQCWKCKIDDFTEGLRTASEMQ